MTSGSRPQHVTAAIFDLDGLLLDTEPIYLRATTEVLARHGRDLERDVLRRFIGIPSVQTMRHLGEFYQLDVPAEQLNQERDAILKSLLPTASARPGARELTAALRGAGIPIAVGTSSTRDTFALKVGHDHAWLDTFDCVVTSDDVERGKPHPDIFLRAAEQLARPPSECLVFEDARSGVEAAQTAGMAVVMVPTEGVDTKGLHPNEMLRSLADFDATRWQLI